MPKREHRSNAEWQDIVERQDQSGLTGVAFCLQEGIYARTFYRQRKLLRRKDLESETMETIRDTYEQNAAYLLAHISGRPDFRVRGLICPQRTHMIRSSVY